MMQRRQPAMLKRYATGAQRQLLNMRCDYGWLVGDKLDETIKYLALLRSTKINPHGANFLRPFCAQLAWDWAPEHMRAKRHHEAAAALIFEYATGKPKQKLRRACSDVRKKMRTSRSKK